MSILGYSALTLIRNVWRFEIDSSVGKESAFNAGDPDPNPGLGRAPGEGIGYPLQYSSLEKPHGQRSLVGYGPYGCKESDTTEMT